MARLVRSRAMGALLASVAATPALAQYAITTRVSVGPGGVEGDAGSSAAKISADGNFVVFNSGASTFVPGLPTGNLYSHVFIVDRAANQIGLVSIDSGGVLGNKSSSVWSISRDGRYVGFASDATNLVPSDTNAKTDCFVRDRIAGTTSRISVDANGAQANQPSWMPVISADGTKAAFLSIATNLVPGDTNGRIDTFFKDLVSGQVTRINLAPGGAQANGDSYLMTMSDDGQWVSYLSTASNLVANDTNGVRDAFVTNTVTGVTQRVSIRTGGFEVFVESDDPVISRDGSTVAFGCAAPNLVPFDTNNVADVFVHDIASAVTERVSLTTGGGQANNQSLISQLSADGRFVAFQSYATNLLPGDTNSAADVFVYDRLAQRVVCASLGSSGEFVSPGSSHQHWLGDLSGDGRYVALWSAGAGLVANDVNHAADVFVRDWLASSGPVPYCTASVTSGGCTPQISASSNPSATLATPCPLAVSNVDAQRSGLFFYALNAQSSPPLWGGGPSFLCVRPPTQRTPLQDSGGSASTCTGSFQLDWNAFQTAQPGSLGNPWTLGVHMYVQAWFRDPGSAYTTALTSALELTAQP